MKLKRMYENGELPSLQSGRPVQPQGIGAQDDTMSHRSGPHSINETNTVASAGQMQCPREKAPSMMRSRDMCKLAQVATNNGGRMPFGLRNGNGLAQQQDQ